MKNILVPIGTSERAVETLQYAVDFAAEFSATVFVMDVIKVKSAAGSLANFKEKVVQNSKEQLKEIIGNVQAKSVEIKIATYTGELIDGLKEIDAALGIDLIIIAPRSNDIREELYLGNTSGSIIKRTNIPTLVVPRGTVFTPFTSVLAAFKSGILKRKRILNALEAINDRFNTTVRMLLVKTPGYSDDDLKVNPALMDISSQLTITENATTYQGVLENFHSNQPDLLCVFRRKRGFFKKLWESNTILKSEFHASIPVLILSDMKKG